MTAKKKADAAGEVAVYMVGRSRGAEHDERVIVSSETADRLIRDGHARSEADVEAELERDLS